MHENEPERPTTTSCLIRKLLPATQTYIWQRKQPPADLIEQIDSSDIQAWLLFPADREDLKQRQQAFNPDNNRGKQQLIIVPDGTWKEVRKLVRKSPWLDTLPLLAFDPSEPSIYDLRRNPDADHLCTAETVVQLLYLNNERAAADALLDGLKHFIAAYKRSKLN